jgi:membrane protease YdiL (CAAX protease family)
MKRVQAYHEGRLAPRRFPWTGANVLCCSAVVAATYLALMLWRPFGSLDPPLSALVRTGILAVAFVVPPLLVLLVRERARRGAIDAPRTGPLALWTPTDRWPRDVVAGIVLGLLLAFMNGIRIQIDFSDAGCPPPAGFAGMAWQSRSMGQISVLLLAVGLVAPVAEEVFFRGVLYPGLRKRLPAVPSVLLSSAAFGAAHFESMRLHAFLLGLVAAILVEYTGSLVPAILAHAGVNMGFVLFLANGGILARTVPFGGVVGGFVALNFLLFLLGQPLFGRPEGNEPPAAGPSDPPDTGDGPGG